MVRAAQAIDEAAQRITQRTNESGEPFVPLVNLESQGLEWGCDPVYQKDGLLRNMF